MWRLLVLLLSFLFWYQPLAAVGTRCYTSSNITIVHDALASQESLRPRAASALKAQIAQLWPLRTVGSEQLRVVKYCYATKVYRDYLHCNRVNPALKIWGDKLGEPAAEHGHSVAWKEAGYMGKDGKRKRAYCYTNYEHGKGGKWNKNVDKDTLAIYLDPTLDGARATTGYDASSDEAGRHEMVLGVDTDPIEIAHELGHVFGMVHEQVRNDRDEHVQYDCRNVIGYTDALDKAIAAENLPEVEAHRRLCEERAFAEKYSFMGSQFTKNPRGKIHDEPGGFDMESIMMYSSYVFADPACDKDRSKCPLLKLMKVNGEVVGTNRILENTEPSQGDVAWLKMWYPNVDGVSSGS